MAKKPSKPSHQALSKSAKSHSLHNLKLTLDVPKKSVENGKETKRKREDDDVAVIENSKKKKENVVVDDIVYGKVKLGGSDRKKGRKVSRQAELARARKLEEARRDPEKAGVVENMSWTAAMDRASGVKVHDNPRLLSRSLAKEKRRRKKSAGKWMDRKETVDKLREGKQRKRKDNINDRIRKKKMRKIEKREKKLMYPGFEGRKANFALGISSDVM